VIWNTRRSTAFLHEYHASIVGWITDVTLAMRIWFCDAPAGGMFQGGTEVGQRTFSWRSARTNNRVQNLPTTSTQGLLSASFAFAIDAECHERHPKLGLD
jgi:hypothetical protein